MASFWSRKCGLTFSKSCSLFQFVSPSEITYVGRRYLLSREALGLDSYQAMRSKTEKLLGNVKDQFCARMENYLNKDQQAVIYTDDLKSMVSLATDSDLNLVIGMVKRFHQQNSTIRFDSFVFGPVVMRLFYYLNKTDEVLQIIKDEELTGFFDQVSSYVVILDLLYNNERYQDVLDVYDIMSQKSLSKSRFQNECFILVSAVCYQLNTPESHQYALQLLKARSQYEAELSRRSITFLTALALNQNDPHSAIEILTLTRQTNYITVRNLKAIAFADLDRPQDSLPLIAYCLERDFAFAPKKTGDVCSETLEKVKKSVERLDNQDITRQFDRIHKFLVEGGHICSEPLSQLLTQNIDSPSINYMKRSQFRNNKETSQRRLPNTQRATSLLEE